MQMRANGSPQQVAREGEPMPRTSKPKHAGPVRRKKLTNKGEPSEKSSLPMTGNVSVTVNLVWPTQVSAARKEVSNVVSLWIWKIIRLCLDKVWMIFRP